MANPNSVIPQPWGASRRGAVSVNRTIRVLTETMGIPALAEGNGAISGTVTFNGAPGANAVCTLLTDPQNGAVAQAVADGAGAYLFANLPAGRYQVVAYDPTMTYRSKVAHTVVPPEAGVLTILGTVNDAGVNRPYNQRLQVENVFGAGSVSVSAGVAPAWLTVGWDELTDQITFTGTPTVVAAPVAFTVKVTDSLSREEEMVVSIEVLLFVATQAIFWEIYVTDIVGPSPYYVLIQEIEMRATYGGANQCSGGTAYATSSTAGYGPEKAFDGNKTVYAGGAWATSNSNPTMPQVIGYQFPALTEVVEIEIWCANTPTGPQGSPRVFYIRSSPDGIIWTTEKIIVDNTPWVAGASKVFQLP